MPSRIQALQCLPYQSLRKPSKSSLCAQCFHKLQQRQFSSTPPQATRQRDDMFRWLTGPGAAFKDPLPSSTNYLNAYDKNGVLYRAVEAGPNEKSAKEGAEEDLAEGSEDGERIERKAVATTSSRAPLPKETQDDFIPFPMNKQFRSQPVLSEELKEEIYKRVMLENQDVRTVSAALSVEMRRVGAVVRLKALEKEWVKEGKPLAKTYAKAIMGMLPQTPYIPNRPAPHESISDLPVHKSTTLQVFHPVSESRQFTRTDAAKVFDRSLLPAEDRIPHPELVQLDKWKYEGIQYDVRMKMQKEAIEKEVRVRKLKEKARLEKEKLTTKVAETPRWQFKFKDISVESVGKDGRARGGVGARYGMPFEDRKKGIIKIPRRVE